MAKIRITFKSPDSVWDSIKEAGIDPNEVRDSEFGKVINKFVDYMEYVTIELDSETDEATVVPSSDSF